MAEINIMESIDKMDGFKRFMLILPIEFAFILIAIILAYQGHIIEAATMVSGVFGIMVGYYFGKSSVAPTVSTTTEIT
jgi:hypothetical protein